MQVAIVVVVFEALEDYAREPCGVGRRAPPIVDRGLAPFVNLGRGAAGLLGRFGRWLWLWLVSTALSAAAGHFIRHVFLLAKSFSGFFFDKTRASPALKGLSSS